MVVLLICGVIGGRAEEVTIPCSWGEISATLATPEGGSDTAILIIAGSGPTDRNGNSGLNLNTYAYKMLSDALTAEGYAVLRYDKRAIGLRLYSGSKETESGSTDSDSRKYR